MLSGRNKKDYAAESAAEALAAQASHLGIDDGEAPDGSAVPADEPLVDDEVAVAA